jgi:NDP-sugar pyrophosphorylase family protein
MLLRVADKLVAAGASRIVVNVHHHAGKLRGFVERLKVPGVEFVVSDESGQLLDTGGGLKKASGLFRGGGPAILYNADVLCDIDLGAMLSAHQASGALVTLAVSRRDSSRYFLWDGSGRLRGWENRSTRERILCGGAHVGPLTPRAFSGIHVISPRLSDKISETGVFSILDVYLRLAGSEPVRCFEHDHRYWADIGSPEKLHRAEALFREHPEKFSPGREGGWAG